jgi:hypothetical protein
MPTNKLPSPSISVLQEESAGQYLLMHQAPRPQAISTKARLAQVNPRRLRTNPRALSARLIGLEASTSIGVLSCWFIPDPPFLPWRPAPLAGRASLWLQASWLVTLLLLTIRRQDQDWRVAQVGLEPTIDLVEGLLMFDGCLDFEAADIQRTLQ